MDEPARVIEKVTDLDTPPAGNAFGQSGKSARSIYIFSQGAAGEQDTQVFDFQDAMLIRAWQKWDRGGVLASDYDFTYAQKARERNIGFVAGGTASVVFRDENPGRFKEWATRDAMNGLVEHTYIVPGAHRASLANPEYREYLVSYCKLQIDGGVDGVFLDEANAGYTGGDKWSWNGNEGYDDYFLADFNAYLMKLHPDYSVNDWIREYSMSESNVIRKDIPEGNLARNFNYRVYLNKKGWGSFPRSEQNPLAPVWGNITGNRADTSAKDFRNRALVWYWRDIVTQIREYARTAYGKEILITSNGIFPFVDFNSFGMYNYNADYKNAEVRWVPVKNGHLDGSVSLKKEYVAVRERSRSVSGDVPLVFFIDWPTEMMNSYYNLPLAEKKDFWRIYAAEAYACGTYYAFHLKTSMPDEPSAREQKVLDFLSGYAAFYRENAALYTSMSPTDINATVGIDNITSTVSSDGQKYCLHLVNHNYSDGLKTKSDFSVSFNVATAPARAVLYTPDADGSREVPLSLSGSRVTVKVDKLVSYDCIVIE